MTTVVGIYVRQAGVWERANAGTPEGFSGPQVRQGGTWDNITSAQAYNSGWNYCWVNIDGELSFQNVESDDFDLSPYNVSGRVTVRGDGSMSKLHFGSNNELSDWRPYDCGREYEIKWEHNSGDTANSTPTLDTWLNLTDPDTDTQIFHSESGSGFFFYDAEYLVRIREKVSAPSSGNDSALLSINLSAEF